MDNNQSFLDLWVSKKRTKEEFMNIFNNAESEPFILIIDEVQLLYQHPEDYIWRRLKLLQQIKSKVRVLFRL
jgi:hypothetical protein